MSVGKSGTRTYFELCRAYQEFYATRPELWGLAYPVSTTYAKQRAALNATRIGQLSIGDVVLYVNLRALGAHWCNGLEEPASLQPQLPNEDEEIYMAPFTVAACSGITTRCALGELTEPRTRDPRWLTIPSCKRIPLCSPPYRPCNARLGRWRVLRVAGWPTRGERSSGKHGSFPWPHRSTQPLQGLQPHGCWHIRLCVLARTAVAGPPTSWLLA